MNRAAKKRRAKRRSQQYASEKVLEALANGSHPRGAILRHGDTVTFYKADGKPAVYGDLNSTNK